MTPSGDSRRPVGPAFPGPLLLLFPLLLLAAAIQYQRTRRPEPGPPPAQPEEPLEGLVPGWLGHAEVRPGTQLRARLSRLHADPKWQGYDSASLARRLDLEAGEPLRLELSFDGDPTAAPLDLAELRVIDASGLAAAPFVAPPLESKTAIVDPLWGALAAPPLVAPGETARMVLWGRSPAPSVTLVGSFGEVALFAESIAIEGRESVLASLEEHE